MGEGNSVRALGQYPAHGLRQRRKEPIARDVWLDGPIIASPQKASLFNRIEKADAQPCSQPNRTFPQNA